MHHLPAFAAVQFPAPFLVHKIRLPVRHHQSVGRYRPNLAVASCNQLPDRVVPHSTIPITVKPEPRLEISAGISLVVVLLNDFLRFPIAGQAHAKTAHIKLVRVPSSKPCRRTVDRQTPQDLTELVVQMQEVTEAIAKERRETQVVE